MVFEEVEGKTNHRWWLWIFASPSPKIVVFVLDRTRSAAVPKRSLGELLTPEQVTALADSPLAARIVWVDEKPYLLPPTVRLISRQSLKFISADRLRVYPALHPDVWVAFCWSRSAP